MIYETTRLYTREMTIDDMPALRRILQDESVMYAYEHAFDEQETANWMNRQMESYRERDFGLWAVILKETGEMIGQCGLILQNVGGREVLEIGYHLQKEHWHRGYAIEAARGSTKYAFEMLGESEVFSMVRDTNIASMNVAIRNGMTVRSRFVKHYHHIDMQHFLFSVKKTDG